ncbi:MAG: hypothetical protein M5U18_09975 [Dehalococcoidia bacterium]|nr:hypothetical protein [Dehalococcoidia bacterium]
MCHGEFPGFHGTIVCGEDPNRPCWYLPPHALPPHRDRPRWHPPEHARGGLPATGEALQRAAAAGILLAPATARWYQAAIRPFEALGLRVAAIASAGSDVRGADGTVLAQDPLPGDFAAFVAGLCDRAGWPATLAVPSKAYRRANELPSWAANAPEWLRPVTHLRDADLSGLLAVLAEPQPGDPYLHELEAWRGRVSMHSAVAYNGDAMVTLTAPGVDKGSGLLALCRSLGIDPPTWLPSGTAKSTSPCFPSPAWLSRSNRARKQPAPLPTASSPRPTTTASPCLSTSCSPAAEPTPSAAPA